jgi:hypothetical protein
MGALPFAEVRICNFFFFFGFPFCISCSMTHWYSDNPKASELVLFLTRSIGPHIHRIVHSIGDAGAISGASHISNKSIKQEIGSRSPTARRRTTKPWLTQIELSNNVNNHRFIKTCGVPIKSMPTGAHWHNKHPFLHHESHSRSSSHSS